MIGAAQQFTEDNKWVSLMIDSGAATPVCPPWFATQFPLQHLEHETGPQLRTVTNQHIKLHGCRWVCVTNHSGQQMFLPFYVCEHRTQQHHTPPKVQLDKDYRILQKYIMEGTTGTEKAHTGREYTSSHTRSILHTRADT